MKALIFLFFMFIGLSAADPSSCGYKSCNPTKDGMLNVHLVAHTHDDVGWLKTVDQYFYGSRNSIQLAGVQYILDTVIEELMKDPNRRFIYVETAFFDQWWRRQGDHKRHIVKRLVSEGRLEFIGGGWSMNDEATVHYQSAIDQMTWGMRMLNDTFGECGRPRVAWQIDPFGHSRESANLWASVGYDAVLFGRGDFQDKARRLSAREAEMVWRGSDDLGEKSELFTAWLYNNYSPPPGFCFDVLCDDDPFIDDVRSPDYNVDKMVDKFIEYANKQANAFKTKHIIMTMGEDFNYQNALMWFKNLDKLIKYVNARNANINVIYSTPSCYIKALNDANTTWPIKQDDFLPYASDEHSFWTGFYTSRPTIKYFERRGNNFLQACKQLYAMTNLNEQDKIDLNMLRSAMGVMQHHDAVTGTEKQHVARDYARLLHLGMEDCLITTAEALNKLMSDAPKTSNRRSVFHKEDYLSEKKIQDTYMSFTMCQLNNTECEVTESQDKFVVTIYNPLGHVRNEYIRLPVTGTEYVVKDTTGTVLISEIVDIPASIIEQMSFRKSNATRELIFNVQQLPPLGYRSYYIENTTPKQKSATKKIERRHSPRFGGKGPRMPTQIDSDPDRTDYYRTFERTRSSVDNSIKNNFLKLTIDPKSGLLATVTFLNDGNEDTHTFTQQLLYYEGMAQNENSKNYTRPSGAYIFRPRDASAVEIGKNIDVKIIKGAMVEEIHQRFSDWASQVIRIYRDQPHVEFEWVVGPIPIEDKIGKEVISRFTTDINNNGVFYTDSNGRQMIKRIINQRPTWKLDLKEPVAGNYYPITSMISIKDEQSKSEINILNDRAQGGSSLNNGEIELMVHRRLLFDDAFGVGEPLNETENGIGLVAKGNHYVTFSNLNTKAVYNRQLALMKLLQPVVLLTPANNLTFAQWQKNKNEFSGILAEVPGNVHILTLEPWRDGTILLRLEHLLQKTDNPEDLSKPALVNLNKLFTGIKITSMRETTLAANQWLENSKRLDWKKSGEFVDDFNEYYGMNDHRSTEATRKKHKRGPLKNATGDDLLITLNAMEIRTFIIKAKFTN